VRDNDGRKLDHATLEALRIRACQQIENGARAEDVAADLGLNRSTVFGWIAAYRRGGAEALAAKPVPGRPPKLSKTQMGLLFTMIEGSNPAQFQLEFALWTRDLVRQVIAKKFGIDLSVGSVGRILRGLGLSPQRPLHRATQQDPERVARWKAEEYPTIRKEAAQVGATVYFADEAGLRSDYHGGTTWAPVGQTPIVRTTGARHSINMISAVTAKGAMHFTTFIGKMNAEVFISYCRSILHDDGGIVFLILDGHPVHRSRAVKEFAASTKGKLRLFFLSSPAFFGPGFYRLYAASWLSSQAS
jgi:transposase